MKKILFYLCGIYNGGTEIETLNFMKNIDRQKYDLYYSYNDKENSYGWIVDEFNKYSKYVDINEPVEVDTILYCTHALDDLDLIKNISYKHSYFWFHYFWEDQEEFLDIAIKNNYIDKVITVSEYAQKKLQNMPCLANRQDDVIVIKNIMNDKEIIKGSNEKIEMEHIDGLNLVTVARFAPIKGYKRVKEMIDILIEENISFKWYICGKGKNEEEHNGVLELLEGYDNRVEMVGHKDNPYPYIKNADYLVLMSDRETAGLVIEESKIIGTPCILSSFEAAFEQVEEGKTGFILDKENVRSEFKEKLPKIMSQKKEIRENLKQYKYSRGNILEEWDELL